ncbi:hypothetical protein DY000_02048790 [Brassica cretica]|uniref:Uncharacterized protein n=1 Tax=Brassica cretica TaxID=69181 RepID=A0ABQ7F7I9_BRACR|nr:hypothetical protein DY000_02048790 [Brassica cretica]
MLVEPMRVSVSTHDVIEKVEHVDPGEAGEYWERRTGVMRPPHFSQVSRMSRACVSIRRGLTRTSQDRLTTLMRFTMFLRKLFSRFYGSRIVLLYVFEA